MQDAFSPLGTTKSHTLGLKQNSRSMRLSLVSECVQSEDLSTKMCGRSGSRCRGICLASAPERCVRHAMAQHFLGSPVGRGRAGRKETDGDERTVARTVLRRRVQPDAARGWYLRSDGCRIREPDIFRRLEISQRDEISKCSTCLKMHGIPQGWARACGYKSSTPCTWCKDRKGV